MIKFNFKDKILPLSNVFFLFFWFIRMVLLVSNIPALGSFDPNYKLHS